MRTKQTQPKGKGKPELPKYYECGICGSFHSAKWNGDCREDGARFAMDELDEKHGPLGWTEIPMEDLL